MELVRTLGAVVLAHDRQRGRRNGDLEGRADIVSNLYRLGALANASAHPDEVVRFEAGPGGQQEERVPAAEQIALRETIREMIDRSSDDDGGESSCENTRSLLFVEQQPTFELSLHVCAGGWSCIVEPFSGLHHFVCPDRWRNAMVVSRPRCANRVPSRFRALTRSSRHI
jgi:hypothetical protein